MADILLHPATTREIEALARRPRHALLIVGEEGSGTDVIADMLAKRLLGISELENYPYLMHITPEKGTIGIGQVRELNGFLRLKTTGGSDIRRVVVIAGAETMPREAQNALLKILEEPPHDTVLILTSTQSGNLLPTIHSRVRRLDVSTPTEAESIAFYSSYGRDEVSRAYMISNGQQALLAALLEQNTDHPLVLAIQQAKRVFSSTLFERLAMIDVLARDKTGLPAFLQACSRVANAALTSAVLKKSPSAKRWHAALKRIKRAESELKSSPNAKLLLTDLMLSL